MKLQKICIIGEGLAGLTTSAILGKQNVNIDFYSGSKKKFSRLDKRTTAISKSNFQYIKKNLNFFKDGFFWPCKKINLFFEDKKKIINFLNFDEKNNNYMYVFQNKDLKKILKKIISSKKNIKSINKNVESVNSDDNSITLNKKKFFYDLIILSIGSLSKFYSKIESGRSIKKIMKR